MLEKKREMKEFLIYYNKGGVTNRLIDGVKNRSGHNTKENWVKIEKEETNIL